jgi:transposase
MAMVCGLDLDREQITFDAVEVDSGEVWRGRGYGQPVAIAVEGCTGWRDVVEEITAAGFEAHLAEPAETQAARGPKRRAKTDRSDCRLLRDLLVARSCRRRGSRRPRCWNGGSRFPCTSRWSISARSGCSASMPSSSSTP